MAKINPILGDLRGKLAGNVFSKNSAAAYVRQKVTPVNPNTAKQQSSRSKFGTNSQAWRGLTTDQRNSFNSNAPLYPHFNVFGVSAPLTGQQLFMSLNNNLKAANASTITLCQPPAAIPAATATGFVSARTGGTKLIQLIATTASYSVIVQATAPYSAGRKAAKNQFRQITIKSGVAVAADLDLSTVYQNAFGYATNQLPIGSAVDCRIIGVNLTTGQYSVITSFTAIIGA